MKVLTNLLKTQTIDAQDWTEKLVNDISEDKWFITPEIIETNLAWQVGHLTLSQYYYTVVLINGPQIEFAQKISIKRYSGLFSNGIKKKELTSEVSVKELLINWKLIQDKTIEVLSDLNDDNLDREIYKLPKPHPFVKTQQDAISWNIKHTMWHCGQIAMLKRVIDKPFDFGMQKRKAAANKLKVQNNTKDSIAFIIPTEPDYFLPTDSNNTLSKRGNDSLLETRAKYNPSYESRRGVHFLTGNSIKNLGTFNTTWEGIIDRSHNKKLEIYFFPAFVMTSGNYTWKEIWDKKMYTEKKEFSESELKKLNWNIYYKN